MNSWNNELLSVLKPPAVIMGIGNRMKGDDAAGPELIDRLQGKVKALCLDAGMVPENFLEVAVRAQPRTLLIIDATHFDGQPGEIKLFTPDIVPKGSFSTHALSITLACDYWKNRAPEMKIFLVGIQASQLDLEGEMTAEVAGAVEAIYQALLRMLS